MIERPVLTLRYAELSSYDVVGQLISTTGDVLATKVSPSITELRSDLAVAARLSHLYPDGYETYEVPL